MVFAGKVLFLIQLSATEADIPVDMQEFWRENYYLCLLKFFKMY